MRIIVVGFPALRLRLATADAKERKVHSVRMKTCHGLSIRLSYIMCI